MAMVIDKELLDDLFAKAEASDRKRMNFDLRTSAEDGGQRMLNALLPGTVIPIHRHPFSNENVLLLSGKIVEVLYEEDVLGESLPNGEDCKYVFNGMRLRESVRYILDASAGVFGCVVPANVWHTVETIEPSVIYEAKDGKYGEDGSESL